MIRSTWFASFWSLERNLLAVPWIRFLIVVVMVVLWIMVESWVNLGLLQIRVLIRLFFESHGNEVIRVVQW